MGIGEQLPQFDKVSCYENVYARLPEKGMKALRILIADDHDLMRRGVKALQMDRKNEGLGISRSLSNSSRRLNSI